MWLLTKLCYPDNKFVQVGRYRTSLSLPIKLQSQSGKHSIQRNALINSGETASFINWRLVNQYNMKMVPLPKEVVVCNVDNTTNVQGMLKEQVFLAVHIKDHQEVLCFYVSDLGKDEIILGHNWLKQHNPNIDWRDATINLSRCNFTCQLSMDDKW